MLLVVNGGEGCSRQILELWYISVSNLGLLEESSPPTDPCLVNFMRGSLRKLFQRVHVFSPDGAMAGQVNRGVNIFLMDKLWKLYFWLPKQRPFWFFEQTSSLIMCSSFHPFSHTQILGFQVPKPLRFTSWLLDTSGTALTARCLVWEVPFSVTDVVLDWWKTWVQVYEETSILRMETIQHTKGNHHEQSVNQRSYGLTFRFFWEAQRCLVFFVSFDRSKLPELLAFQRPFFRVTCLEV